MRPHPVTTLDELAAARRGDARSLTSVPLHCDGVIPLSLLVAEAARETVDSRAVHLAASALAPSWGELERFGLTHQAPSLVEDAADSLIAEHVDAADPDAANFLCEAVAISVAHTGAGCSIAFEAQARLSQRSAVFKARLRREAARTGFRVTEARAERAAPDLPSTPSLRALALCPHGAPLALIVKVAGSSHGLQASLRRERGGKPWLWLTRDQRRVVLSRLPLAERRALHARIYDESDPSAWGYVERSRHAIGARSAGRLKAQHLPVVAGLLRSAPELVLRHLVALLASGQMPPAARAHVLLKAARIAISVNSPPAARLARLCLRRILSLGSSREQRLTALIELANAHAVRRRESELQRAESLCALAKDLLPSCAARARADAEVRIANLLALVSYHRGHDQRALLLEQQGLRAVEDISAQHPDLAVSLRPLLRRNTAQLLERRFSDVEAACALLEANLQSGERQSAMSVEADGLELARLHFDRKSYAKVIELLAPSCEQGRPLSLNLEREFFARSLLTFALLRASAGARARAQVVRLAAVGRRLNTPGAERVVRLFEELQHAAERQA